MVLYGSMFVCVVILHHKLPLLKKGTTGPELAKMMEEYHDKVHEETELAIRGTNYLTKEDSYELSQPGITTTLAEEAGEIVSIDGNYLRGKDITAFGGMGILI